MQSLCQTYQITLIQKALIDPFRHHTLGSLSELHQEPENLAEKASNDQRSPQTRYTEKVFELRMKVREYRRGMT